MEKEYDTADICEEAHKRTEQECKEKGIMLDTIDVKGDIRYTEKAQDIFNRHFDEVEEEFENGCLHNFQDGICKTCGALRDN